MKMSIEERIAQLVRVKHYASPSHYETLDVAIDTMRKYQKIEELYDYWRGGKCEYTISCMENIGKVLRNGNDD